MKSPLNITFIISVSILCVRCKDSLNSCITCERCNLFSIQKEPGVGPKKPFSNFNELFSISCLGEDQLDQRLDASRRCRTVCRKDHRRHQTRFPFEQIFLSCWHFMILRRSVLFFYLVLARRIVLVEAWSSLD